MLVLEKFKTALSKKFFYYITLLIIFTKFPFALATEIKPANKSAENSLFSQSKKQNKKTNYPAYILGPGDVLRIDFLGLGELSGNFLIGLDGYINLIDVGQVKASDFSLGELETYLENKYLKFVKNPSI